MSGNLAQYIIKDLLCFAYGDSRHFRYLMRSAHRLQQLVLVREFLMNERLAFIQNNTVIRANLLTALLGCIEEELENHSARDIEIAKHALLDADINPPAIPDFLNNLFSLNE